MNTFDPKGQFIANQALASQWDKVASSTQFHKACESAMLVTMQGLGTPQDMGTAAAHAWKLIGARTFLENLMNLTLRGETKPRRTGDNLDHNV